MTQNNVAAALFTYNGIFKADSPNFFEDVLPLLKALLSAVRHFLDSNNLPGEKTSGVVDGTERTMSNLPEVFEYLFRIMLVEKISYLRILERAGPRHSWHRYATPTDTLNAPLHFFMTLWK